MKVLARGPSHRGLGTGFLSGPRSLYLFHGDPRCSLYREEALRVEFQGKPAPCSGPLALEAGRTWIGGGKGLWHQKI